MIVKRSLLIGVSLLVVGSGIYFAKDARIGIGRENLLSTLFAVADKNALNGRTDLPGDAENTAPVKNCSFETREVPEQNSVILNEIAWMGSESNPKNEWIELKNISSEPVDMTGWRLLNQNEKIKTDLGSEAKIAPGDFYLLGREKSVAAGVDADLTYSGTLRNSGDTLRLFDGNCHLIDEVTASGSWPAGNNTTKKTMERDSESLAWYTSALSGGTPKRKNSSPPALLANEKTKTTIQTTNPQQQPTATTTVVTNRTSTNQTSAHNTTAHQSPSNQPPPLCSQNSPRTFSRSVIVNEVAWAGVASDKTSEEWVELKNNSGLKISLEGWQLQNATRNIKVFFGASDSIPAGDFYLLERGSVEFLSGTKADKFFTNAIKNNNEAISLFDKNCNIVDEVSADVGSGGNWPAGTAPPDYRTAERSPDFSWHTYSGSGTSGVFGTPRAENSLPQSATASVASQNQSSASEGQPPPPPPPPTYYTLQVSKSGNGTGSITSNPSGISCTSSCTEDSEDFVAGASIALTASPANDSEFSGWSRDCSGNNTCSFSLDSNKSITAGFNHTVLSVISTSSLLVSSSSASSTAKSSVGHILISQIQTTGGAGQTENDFIEIYNPLSDQFNLKGSRLVKRTKTGTSDTLIKSWTSDAFIPAYGFYLWANSGHVSIAATPDVTTTASIADDSGIAIRSGPNDTGTIIDSVAWGNAQNAFVEGSVFSTNPGVNQSILRKGWRDGCVGASFAVAVGNGCDTENNALDFELMQSSEPRNSQSK